MRDLSVVRVWDFPVRFFHWSLLAAVVFLFVSANSGMQNVHMVLGYFLVFLLIFRIVWGFIGTQYARFTDFVKTPRVVLRYSKNVVKGGAERFIGHNPAGGIMVVALLLVLMALAVSGFILEAGLEYEGPLLGMLDSMPEQRVFWVQNLHEWLVDLLWVLVGLHLAGVVHASVQHQENLVKAMLTGRKCADES